MEKGTKPVDIKGEIARAGFQEGDTLYAMIPNKTEKTKFIMDTGANISTLNPATGKTNRAKQMTIQLADGQLKRAVVKTFGPIEGVEGHMNLLGVNDFPLADTHVGKPPPQIKRGPTQQDMQCHHLYETKGYTNDKN